MGSSEIAKYDKVTIGLEHEQMGEQTSSGQLFAISPIRGCCGH
jgi:hypothetical protein